MEANTALPFLIQHQLTCPINKESRVVTELAIEALDTDADITVSTRPDLIYKNGDDLVWREIKTVSSIQDIEKDIYFNIYPQLPLAIRLMVEDCLPKEEIEKLGNFKNKRVELELISNDECKTISWDCDDANVKLSAWSQLAEQVDSWASDTLFAPSPNPPCNWCKVSKWCEFANAEQVQADIGGLQVDLKTGEIIENEFDITYSLLTLARQNDVCQMTLEIKNISKEEKRNSLSIEAYSFADKKYIKYFFIINFQTDNWVTAL